MKTNTETNVTEFYDVLAPDYDSMTGFEKRFVAERPFFRIIVERYNITNAVDAGCGTGFHALTLAQLGVDVTAVDVSPAMLQAVSQHARQLNLLIQTAESDFQNLADTLQSQYDAVFCLGNALAHLLDDNAIAASLSHFARVLKNEGWVFIQLLNYRNILAQRKRVQSVKESGNTTFVRFYDFENKLLRFNILKLDRSNSSATHSLNSILLRPFQQDELSVALKEAGFENILFFGGISLEEYHADTSKDLVVVARKRRTSSKGQHQGSPQKNIVLDVRIVPASQRHSLIFNTFDELSGSETIQLISDHEPRPLLYTFQAERKNRFVWEYQEQGPEVWRVNITKL